MVTEAEGMVTRHHVPLRPSANEEECNNRSDGYGRNMNECVNDETTFRIMTVNCQGFPVRDGNPTRQQIFEFISTHRPDVIGFSEMNECWTNIPDTEQLRERTRGWFRRLHHSISYNYHDSTSSR